MATVVSNTFDRILKNHTTNTTPTQMWASSGIEANTQAVIMGLVITNVIGDGESATTTDDVLVSIAVNAVEGNTVYLVKNTKVPDGEAMVIIGWDQKLVLKTGDNISISTNAAGKNVDVSLSFLKVTTTTV